VPLPMIRSPVVVMGDSALKAADAEACPVPPLAMASVPAKVTAPVVLVLGVNPVVPAEKLVTPVLLIVIEPEAFVTPIAVPAVRVAEV